MFWQRFCCLPSFRSCAPSAKLLEFTSVHAHSLLALCLKLEAYPLTCKRSGAARPAVQALKLRCCGAGAGANADFCLLVFTLGALRQEAMPRMLRTVFQARQGACEPA